MRFPHRILRLTAATAVLMAGANRPVEPVRYETHIEAMGGVYSLVLYGTDQAKLEAAATSAFEEIQRLDQMLSNYKPSSEWSELNRRAGEGPVAVSPECYDLLRACLDYSRRSDGAFDITVGPLMKVWGFYKGSGRLPHRAEIRTALANIGSRHITLDPVRKTARFERPGMEIDPGGIGKGYAVDRAVAVLREAGVTSAFVSAATSTVYGMGTPPSDARGWEVRIVDPKNRNETVEKIYLKDESLSTSGNYEKFFVAGGRLYSHIMDPRTGSPARGMLQVTVVAPRALDSEAWTKPVYVNGRAWLEAARQKDRQLKALRVFACEDGWDNRCAWLQ